MRWRALPQPQATDPLRRRGLQRLVRGLLGLAALPVLPLWPGSSAQAQRMVSGQLLSLPDMLAPLLQGASALAQDVRLVLPILADNGYLVPVTVQVQSPMTPTAHVTHIYLLSQRNPATQMAVFHLGPWSGRAEVSARVRLAGSQKVVALARLSDGSFRYQSQDVIVTESACVDGS
jgi:sulfur-oxidizing protein SoxY